uniref:Agglutinin_C domain-containing protein n=1 Tax=Elaeophora elaphi TaxID=1147741 RepID=A0A0R3RVP3_9BILA
MYVNKIIWYDGTPATTDFSSFYDHSFDPRVNKSNCYRFMTWAIEDNDCKTILIKNLDYPKRCALGDHGWKGADGETHCFSIVYKMSNHTEQLYSIDDSLCRIQRQRKHIAMYPAVFREKEEYEFIIGKLQVIHFPDDLKADQPMFYQHHSILFGLWYFRGAGYRWSDLSQNSNFEFIDPNFNPQLNTSQCYRFLAIPC